jgi:hypothetical protein
MFNNHPKTEDIKELVQFLGENRVARFKGLGIEVELHPDLDRLMEQQQTPLTDTEIQDQYLNRSLS